MTVKEKYIFANPTLSEARLQDVIAKMARVTLKDTIRVLKALDLVAEFTNDDADFLLGHEMSSNKPTAGESASCVRAFNLISDVLGQDAVSAIRQID